MTRREVIVAAALCAAVIAGGIIRLWRRAHPPAPEVVAPVERDVWKDK